jgi:hypothetical protein
MPRPPRDYRRVRQSAEAGGAHLTRGRRPAVVKASRQNGRTEGMTADVEQCALTRAGMACPYPSISAC